MKSEIKRDSWTILFCVMNSWLFNGFLNELFSNGCVKFWPGFWQDMNFVWINKSNKPDL